jgi:hypothetical protein
MWHPNLGPVVRAAIIRAANAESPGTKEAISKLKRITNPKYQLAINQYRIAKYHVKVPCILDC